MDLAKESEFGLGGLRIRPALRQVDSVGGSETLEPRIMQVLVVLARKRGDVVSRDQLIEECWDGLSVGEDSISRCIYRLRKLGESTGAFGVETITKVGYRLVEATPEASRAGKVGPADPAPAAAPLQPASPRTGNGLRNPAYWLAAGLTVLVLAAVVLLLRPPAPPNVDELVAQLSERLRQEPRLRPGDAEQAGRAVRQLGASRRPQERSAFEALASENGIHALDLLEDLARKLEASGDIEAASEVYTRAGAIAPLFDRARAIASQRKAFELNPDSLRTFQSLFFIHLLGGPDDSVKFANDVLANQGLTDRMRGWALSHRAFFEAESMGIPESAKGTLAEIKALKTFSSDAVLQACATWIEAVIAFGEGRLGEAQALARRAEELWAAIPEKTSNSPEGLLVRILYERGDWEAAFRLGTESFERRSREGDLLPATGNTITCEAGIFTDQPRSALPHCAATARRGEGMPAIVKGQAALVAVFEGDPVRAKRDFETARALLPPGGSAPAMLLIYEAYAAVHSGDIAGAERILSQAPGGRSWEEGTRRRPAVLAAARRLHGQWLTAAGQPRRACAPLAEAEQVYLRYGGDAGRDAVRNVMVAAGCGRG